MTTRWDRIRQRKLVQWTASYAAAVWVALEVVGLLGDKFGWPDALFRSLTVLLAGGLPAAAIVAWFHGERGRQRIVPFEATLLLLVVILTGTALVAVNRRGDAAWLSGAVHAASTFAAAPSVAVLPFKNLGGGSDTEYFSDGITDDIATLLGRTAVVTVVSTAATRRYRDSVLPPASIARELGGIGHVLTGSVQRVGQRVRVAVQLVHGGTNAQLWAEAYDRDLDDLLAVQSDVAQHVARALSARLQNRDGRDVAGALTSNIGAYDLVLKARQHAARRTSEGNDAAIQLYRLAVAQDPAFALAHAELADRYSLKQAYYADPVDWADTAEAVARHALTLQPHSADAHQALGHALLNQGRFGDARTALEAAVRLDPNHAPAVRNLALVASQTGRFDLAVPMYRRAMALDPLDTRPLTNAANVLLRLGHTAQAERLLERARLLDPDGRSVYLVSALLATTSTRAAEVPAQSPAGLAQRLAATFPRDSRALATAGSLHLMAGDVDAAHEHYEAAYALSPIDYEWIWEWEIRAALAYTRILRGDRAGAATLLDDLERDVTAAIDAGNESWSIRIDMAVIQLLRNDRPGFRRWLERAVALGWIPSPSVPQHPLLADVAADADVQRIIARATANRAQVNQRIAQVRW